jgi:histidinol-phosphate aminotransferase
MMEISSYAKPYLASLHPYVPGEQPQGGDWIKLNTNELPYGPPAAVREAIAGETLRLHRYPEPLSRRLREALAERFSLDTENVIIGNGSDDLLNLLVRAFGGRGRQTAETFPSYSLYPVLTGIDGGEMASFPLGPAFELPEEAVCASGADLLFLTSPNAPSGIRFANEALRRIARSIKGIVVIDEAYVEFANGSALSLLETEANVVITRTFSKAYGLAGLRVGYALASSPLIATLDRIRDSYNVNRLSQAGALAALAAADWYEDRVAEIRNRRDRVRATLMGFGWKVFPSESNFLLMAPAKKGLSAGVEAAASLEAWLRERRVLVRRFSANPLTAPYLRVTIGTEVEMDTFLKEADEWNQRV